MLGRESDETDEDLAAMFDAETARLSARVECMTMSRDAVRRYREQMTV